MNEKIAMLVALGCVASFAATNYDLLGRNGSKMNSPMVYRDVDYSKVKKNEKQGINSPLENKALMRTPAGLEGAIALAGVFNTEGLAYGAGMVLYPGFLERVSEGRDLYFIPSSIHEWLYIEDTGDWSREELTGLLRAVNREVVEEKDFLSDDLYSWRDGQFQRA